MVFKSKIFNNSKKNNKKNDFDNYNHLRSTSATSLDSDRQDNIKFYLEELNRAVNSNDVFNIALSGSYGAGKSTIIKTFKDCYYSGKGDVLTIAISSNLKYDFSIDKENCSNDGDNGVIEGTISNYNNKYDKDKSNQIISNNELIVVEKVEESILKQLTFINTSDSMPNSKLQRLNKPNIFKISYIYYLLLLFIIFLIEKNTFLFTDIYFKSFSFLYNYISFIKFIFFSITLIPFLFLFFNFIKKVFLFHSIKKVKISDAEVEFSLINNLPFNEKLYEILYIFMMNDIRVVVFEDIDRFEDDVVLMVMEELKELNTIINNSPFIKNKVSFVYAIKDDIFKDYSKRNKFYDFIISVMPVSTFSNSIMLLTGLFPQKEVSMDLLSILSKYVVDYRTFINIRNDFVSFKNVGNFTYEENDYLLAFVIVKNISYSFYSDMLSSKRFIINVLKKVDLVFENEYLKNKEAVKDISFILKLNNDAFLEGASSYKKFIIDNLLIFDDNNMILKKDGSVVSKNDFSIDDDLKDYRVIDDYLLETLIAYKEIILSNQLEFYFDKYSYFVDKKDDSFASFLRIDSEKIVFNELKKYFNIDNDLDDFVDINFLNVIKLIDELIRNGYLNAEYINYCSLPVSNDSFSVNDYKYIRNVGMGIYSIDIELINLDNVITFVRNNYMDFDYNIMNYSLLKYVLIISENNDVLDKILNEFNDITLRTLKILNDFKFYSIDHYIMFLKKLCLKNSFLIQLSKIMLDANYKNINDYVISEIICDILYFVSFESSYNGLVDFSNSISKVPAIYTNLDFNNPTIVKNILLLKPRFVDVSLIHKEDYDFIIKNRLYSFSFNNIEILNFSFDELDSDFILNIMDNIELFYEEFYKDSKNVINNEIFINKLFKCDISKNFKKELMLREKFTLFDVDLDFPDLMFEHLNPDWNSIYKLFISDTNLNINKYVDFVIEHKDKLLNKKVKIIDMENNIFNDLLIKEFISNNFCFELELYLNNVNVDNMYHFKDSFSINIMEILINHNLIYKNEPDLKKIVFNKKLDDKFRIVYFVNYFKFNGICNSLHYLKHLPNLIVDFLANILEFTSFVDRLKILRKICVDETILKSCLKVIFENKKHIVSKYVYNSYFDLFSDFVLVERNGNNCILSLN